MPSPDSHAPRPNPQGEPEPWSEADFAPIVAFLRNQIGITLEPHRMGLLQARLRSRLQARAYPSFTRFYERVLKADPTGPGVQLLIDLEHGQPHGLLPPSPASFTFMAERLAPIFKDPARPASSGSGRKPAARTGQEPYSMAMVLAESDPHTISPNRVEIWASDLSLEVVKVAARSIYQQTRGLCEGVSPARLH